MSMTVEQLAARIDGDVRGEASREIHRCATLEAATDRDVSFLSNRRYVRQLADTGAGAVIVSPGDAEAAPPGLTLIVVDDPYFGFRNAAVALHGFREQPPAGVSELAAVDATAKLGAGCSIQPFVHIAAGARIGARTVIHPHCYVGSGTVVGEDCVLYPNVTIYERCVLGDRVTLNAGCVIGHDGFGYATHAGRHEKIPHVGRVVIGDDVEIGANCAIDRGSLADTTIGEGTKVSDLVAIGHGVRIGRCNLLVAQVGIAGSSTTGDYVVMGGQVGVAGHLTIADGVQLAAKSGVGGSITQPGQYGGQPAMPFNQAKRSLIAHTKLPELVQQVKDLQRRITELERRADG